jgi:hypothetical protein
LRQLRSKTLQYERKGITDGRKKRYNGRTEEIQVRNTRKEYKEGRKEGRRKEGW